MNPSKRKKLYRISLAETKKEVKAEEVVVTKTVEPVSQSLPTVEEVTVAEETVLELTVAQEEATVETSSEPVEVVKPSKKSKK